MQDSPAIQWLSCQFHKAEAESWKAAYPEVSRCTASGAAEAICLDASKLASFSCEPQTSDTETTQHSLASVFLKPVGHEADRRYLGVQWKQGWAGQGSGLQGSRRPPELLAALHEA